MNMIKNHRAVHDAGTVEGVKDASGISVSDADEAPGYEVVAGLVSLR